MSFENKMVNWLLFILFLVVCVLSIAWWWVDRQEHTEISKSILLEPHVREMLRTLEYPSIPPEVYDTRLGAVIVEPRAHHNLLPVLRNVRQKLPDTPIFWFHGTENDMELDVSNVYKVNLGVSNLSLTEYNCLMTCALFYERLPCEYLLMFQTDSVLFSRSTVKLEDYFEYDYVGAPWSSELHTYYLRNILTWRGSKRHQGAGNGGLSLRKRDVVLRTIQHVPYVDSPYFPEDVYFSFAFYEMGGVKLPSAEKAAALFFEHKYADKLPFGAHKFVPEKFKDEIKPDELNILNTYAHV